MSVIASVTLPADDFALGAAIAPDPGISVRLENVVPVGGSSVPYIWASNEAVDEIRAELRAEGDVASFDVVDRVDDEVLVRIDWAEGIDGFLDALGQSRATVLEGIGEADEWRFRLRFSDHAHLTEFYQSCLDEGITLHVESVHSPGVPRSFDAGIDLTEPQRETLRLAFERGYFDVPRRTNVVELAEELGVSDSAVSQRLRRATTSVLSAVLPEDDADRSDE